jgi:hypothetical protein
MTPSAVRGTHADGDQSVAYEFLPAEPSDLPGESGKSYR